MTIQKLADYVREGIAKWRNPLSTDEMDLAPHLRGNELLYKALVRIIERRMGVRANTPVPSDPLMCKAMLERDNELRWLLSRLDLVYRASVSHPADDSEPPTP